MTAAPRNALRRAAPHRAAPAELGAGLIVTVMTVVEVEVEGSCCVCVRMLMMKLKGRH